MEDRNSKQQFDDNNARERVRHQKTTTRNKYASFSKEQEKLEIHIIPTSHSFR